MIRRSLRCQVVNLAHESHRGIVATKKKLREKIWFPGLDHLVEDTIATCHLCQVTGAPAKQEPLQMSELPRAVWTTLAADFFGPLDTGNYLLVIIDEYSRFPIVRPVSSTSAMATLPIMDDIFAAWGSPETLKTDNGPPFSGEDFRRFMTYLGVRHRKVTPLWPQTNGMVERFMGNIKKAVQRAKLSQISLGQALCQMLRDYRNTPHSSTGKCPAELVLRRVSRTRLPQVEATPTTGHESIAAKDKEAKKKMKKYADSRRHATTSQLQEGDHVIVRQRQNRKSDSTFSHEPLTITKVKGAMIRAESGHKTVTRNSSHFKEFKEEVKEEELGQEEVEETEDTGPRQNKEYEARPRSTRNKPQRLIKEM